jgi:hypothetical protein
MFSVAAVQAQPTSLTPWSLGNDNRPMPKTHGLPDGFIENRGQWDSRALYYSRGVGVDVWVTSTGVVYDFNRPTKSAPIDKKAINFNDLPGREGQVVSLQFLNTAPHAASAGVADQHKGVNFIGTGFSRTAASYKEARVLGLYSGVGLRVYQDNGSPRFDLAIDPGTDPSQIKFKYNGADSAKLSDDGTLLLGTRFGEQRVADLYAYQPLGALASVPVACSFQKNSDGTFGFKVGAYDHSQPLTIDPVIFSTLMGAQGGTDVGFGVAVDGFGDSYITGYTNNLQFPTNNGAYNRNVGNQSVFVTKFTVDATAVVYSTVINTFGTAMGAYIQVDSTGRAVIAGTTGPAYPTTPNAFQSTYGGGNDDVFISRLSADGSKLDYSTYFGTGGDEGLSGMKLDTSGNIYFGGTTNSQNLPHSVDAFQAVNPAGGGQTGYFASLKSTGAFNFGSFFGGSSASALNGFTIDQSNAVYVCGTTTGAFPTTLGAFDVSPHLRDGFVAKFNAATKNNSAAHSLTYSTLLGGSGNDGCGDIAVDQQGDAYVIGSSGSVDFPTTPGAFQRDSNGGNFVAEVALDGASLVYSTYTASGTIQLSIAVDDLGFAYVTGSYNASNGNPIALTGNADGLPYAGPLETPPTPITPGDIFLQVFNNSGTSLIYGTLWGGLEDEVGEQVVVDPTRSAYIAGWTDSFFSVTPASVEFPTTPGVFRTDLFADFIDAAGVPHAFPDAFLIKFRVRNEPVLNSMTINPSIVAGSQSAAGHLVLSAPATGGGESVHLQTSNATLTILTDTNNVPLPNNTITIPGGSSTGDFRVLTTDVTQTNTVKVTAELEGVQLSANITIAPWLAGLRVSPAAVTGGNLASGRVDLTSVSPANGLTINITSSDPTKGFPVNLATGQEQDIFNVPAGAQSLVFDIQTKGVDQTANVTFVSRIVTPSLAQTRSSTLTVAPAHLGVVSFNPPAVDGGTPTVGAVILNGQAGPTPIKVNLVLGSGTAPITLPNPPSLTIAPFTRMALFNVATAAVTSNAFRTVTANRVPSLFAPAESQSGVLFVDQIAIQSINLSTDTVLGGGTVLGTVSVNTPAATGGFTINIASSNPTFAALSANTVTVQPGSIASNQFVIRTPAVDADQTVVITASKVGYVSKTQTLVVRHLAFVFTVTPTTVIGGIQNVAATVTLNEAAPTGGLSLTLTSTNNNALKVTSPLIIPAGSIKTAFTIPSFIVSTQQVVTLTLSHSAIPTAISVSKVVTVSPLSLTVSLNPNSVTGGVSSNGTVKLSSPAPQNVVVTLSSNNAAGTVAPKTVTILKGATSASFVVNTVPVANSLVDTITATLQGGAFNTAKLTILSPRVINLSIAQPVIVGGFNTTGTLSTNAPAPPGGISAQLASSDPSVSVPASVLVPAGLTQVTFAVNTSPVAADTNVTIFAAYPSGVFVTATMLVETPRSGTLTITPNDLVGGGTTVGTASIDVPAPVGGTKVLLQADPSATGTPFVTFPSSVIIPQGKKSITFTITTKPVSRTVGTTITGTFGPSGTQSSATLTIEPSG